MKKKVQNKKNSDVAHLRKVGVVSLDYSSIERAGFYWRSSHRWLPWLALWIKGACTVALIGALACLIIVFSRPRPVLLVSYPDGLTLCSMPPLDQKTGTPIVRPSAEAVLCNSLSARAGRGTDEQNLKFAREVQSEPVFEGLPPLSNEAIGNAPIGPPMPAPPSVQAAPPPMVSLPDGSARASNQLQPVSGGE